MRLDAKRRMPSGLAGAVSDAAAAYAPEDGWRLLREVGRALAQLDVPARTDCTMHRGAAHADLFLCRKSPSELSM